MLLLLALLTRPADACLWDNDTLATEQAGMPEVTAVLAGRFERYPAPYYEARLAIAQARLAEAPDDLAAYDNAAVALDRLGRSTEAIALMEAKAEVLAGREDAEHRYRLLANQGTFYAHRWLSTEAPSPADLTQAIALIEQAIALNPDAHFGREAVQLKALYWLRDAPPLQAPDMLLRRPGLLGFEDWLSQTIDAVRTGEAAPDLAGTIEGLSGLIVLGAAWESPDIHLALARALYASGHASLGWMARLRTIELLESGRRLYRTEGHSTEALVDVLREESTQITADSAAIQAALSQGQAEAAVWRAEREAFILARLAEGRHPDTDPTFWDGAPE